MKQAGSSHKLFQPWESVKGSRPEGVPAPEPRHERSQQEFGCEGRVRWTKSMPVSIATAKATAVMRLPGRLPPSLLNVVLHHAYAVIDFTRASIDFTSNPVPLTLVK